MQELSGAEFRACPDEHGYKKLLALEKAADRLKKNANPELAVSEMFLELARIKKCIIER